MSDSNCHVGRGVAWLCLLLLCGANHATAGAPPVVSNVRAAQRPGTQLVGIYYDLADPDSASLAITVLVSTNGGASYTLPATSFSGSGWGSAVAPGSNRHITWNAGADWSGHYSANVRFRVTAYDAVAPSGMALIPAGSFTMGDSMGDGDSYELPLHTVYVSAFYMDKYDVTKALWGTVYQWATSHGYSFDNPGSGNAANHPVQTIDWYDAVKWCNARSEMEGRTPAYYTSAAQTTVYRSGRVDVDNGSVNWNTGYRLATEAEWEKAARGGISGQRFPWGNTISWSQANYDALPLSADPVYGYAYDVNPTAGYDPAFATTGTSPVGYFAANGYGLYDMAGNVWQWCWDWSDYYASSSQTDPRGPPPSWPVPVACASGRQLGQRRGLLPHGVPQRPRDDVRQHRHRVPLRPALRSPMSWTARTEQARRSEGQAGLACGAGVKKATVCEWQKENHAPRRGGICRETRQGPSTNDSNHHLGHGAALLCLLLFYGANHATAGAPPVVSNVRAAQRPGTQLVDIYYDLADPDSASLAITVRVSTDGGASYTLPATSFSGSGWGSAVTPGFNKQITWNAGADWSGHYSANVRFRVTADDAPAPAGMALIPAGSFTMGNCMDPSEGYSDELPLHTVYVSAFYMDKYLVTKSLWDTVYQWATANGYTFDYAGFGKAANHPVQTIDWYDCVKWCNARSQKEGRAPAYYTDAGLSVRYRSGQVAPYVNWSSGYRLPTEAEWEKAARGGMSGQRFPWGNTISWSQANYYAWPLSAGGDAYDVNPTSGYDPAFNDVWPYTSPVGYFAANGYGLYDMAGNVWQWCWDWYGSYAIGSQTDPRGPASGSDRVFRGGCWHDGAYNCRSAGRNIGYPTGSYFDFGFRSVLPPGQ